MQDQLCDDRSDTENEQGDQYVRVAQQRDGCVFVVRRERRRLAHHQDVGTVVVGLVFPFVLLLWDERTNLLPQVDQNHLLSTHIQ